MPTYSQYADRVAELEDCLKSLVYQFGNVYNGRLSSGCISALEEAFRVLGWPDPCPAPEHLVCDEPGCGRSVVCGWPSEQGYRHTCGEHMRK